MEQSGKPKIAGILLIATGSVGIVGMLLMALIVWALSEGMAVGFSSTSNAPLFLILVIGLIFSIPGIFAVIGGLNALKKRHWGLALAGAICAIVYFNVLGIPALILLILSKNEFLPTSVRAN